MKKLKWTVLLIVFLVIASLIIFYKINEPTKRNSSVIKNEDNKTVQLPFSVVPKQLLYPTEKPMFAHVVSTFNAGEINGSETAMTFLSNDKAAMVSGDTFGFIYHQEKWYSVGNVTNSYGFNSIKIMKWDEPLPSGKLKWIATIENPFTTSKIIGFQADQNQWYSWDVIGTPRLLSEKHNSEQKILISEFLGAHLQASNVIIYQTKENQLQQVNIGDVFGGASVRIVERNDRYYFVVTKGKNVDEYLYDQGKLVQVN